MHFKWNDFFLLHLKLKYVQEHAACNHASRSILALYQYNKSAPRLKTSQPSNAKQIYIIEHMGLYFEYMQVLNWKFPIMDAKNKQFSIRYFSL